MEVMFMITLVMSAALLSRAVSSSDVLMPETAAVEHPRFPAVVAQHSPGGFGAPVSPDLPRQSYDLGRTVGPGFGGPTLPYGLRQGYTPGLPTEPDFRRGFRAPPGYGSMKSPYTPRQGYAPGLTMEPGFRRPTPPYLPPPGSPPGSTDVPASRPNSPYVPPTADPFGPDVKPGVGRPFVGYSVCDKSITIRNRSVKCDSYLESLYERCRCTPIQAEEGQAHAD